MTRTLTFRLDPRTHFPLVEVPGQNFALFWLPLSKIQAEYFLSDTIERPFDRAWYRERLRVNPREVPENLTPSNLIQAFLTGILFDEARKCSEWFGKGFGLPHSSEWQRALAVFEMESADPAYVQQILALPYLHPRARQLVIACEDALPVFQRQNNPANRKLAHQLMLQAGIFEYVYQDGSANRCEACGTPQHLGRAASETTRTLLHPDQGERMGNLGMRPIIRYS